MSAAVVLEAPHGAQVASSPQPLNPPELYLWALGWILEQHREQSPLSQEEFGRELGLSQAGYNKVYRGRSPKLVHFLTGFEFFDKDIVSIMSLARILVRGVQAEESSQDRTLSLAERDAIAEDLFQSFSS